MNFRNYLAREISYKKGLFLIDKLSQSYGIPIQEEKYILNIPLIGHFESGAVKLDLDMYCEVSPLKEDKCLEYSVCVRKIWYWVCSIKSDKALEWIELRKEIIREVEKKYQDIYDYFEIERKF